jgi:hypothetical protein
MRHLPRLFPGSLAVCAAVAVLFLAAPAGAAVSHAAASPAAGRQDAAARHARAVARSGIRRLTARWLRSGAVQRPSSGPAVSTIPGKVTSSSWGGYADISEAFNQVAGKWTQPALTCGSPTTVATTWVGLDGYSDNTVEQAGTLAECVGGTAYYYAWWQIYPSGGLQLEGIPVAPGDLITGSVNHPTKNAYTLAVTDSTQQDSFTANGSCSGCADSSAEWIAGAEAGSSTIIPAFTWSPFAATVTAGVGQGVINSYPCMQIIPVNGSTSALNDEDNGFTVVWKRTTP